MSKGKFGQLSNCSKREWASYIIQFLKAGLTETISLESLVELRTNPFNIRLLQEGWVQGRFTLAFYDADINLFIHQVRNLFYDCTVLKFSIKTKATSAQTTFLLKCLFKNPEDQSALVPNCEEHF